ncbi:solute carrier family 66 member 2-like [Amphibalanus amphitrite]|uniref:solute carrier family 66 member 2-like n=1 Tax=Amphibalanus amphitrite TaxID=1232801 RepID=UPI001C91493D|nr:solute carrier family 66 member 2-like [Amphibalanus amphitrite]XP_043237625.1 solute carrier family 66 member 2-like [Amphibalanus amphitrite]XP_043237626.1 solute carrier family 66 member 2-like [Amphibalanus amphitrite]XP_043239775.1 solute carrier family 66 member 2-like [Amphibalanus amphitrite]
MDDGLAEAVAAAGAGAEPGPLAELSFEEQAVELLLQAITVVSAGAMVLGGAVPYIPQYLEIKRNQNTDGFSLFVCLALLLANTLRILFWMGHPFELPLLAQSVIMNVVMLLLIHVCVTVKARQQIVKHKERTFTDFDMRYFWEWTDFESYVECMLTFALVGSVLMYFLIDNPWFVETVGFLAVFTEAMLGAPQFYKNFEQKSTYGMSVKMVVMWTCGDTFKTVYFIVRSAPAQFWLCGFLQMGIDVAILAQVAYYRQDTLRRRKSDLGR